MRQAASTESLFDVIGLFAKTVSISQTGICVFCKSLRQVWSTISDIYPMWKVIYRKTTCLLGITIAITTQYSSHIFRETHFKM